MIQSGDLLLLADVVENGSLSAAARKRRQTRSMISKRLQTLESELGARLLNRTTRSISLTEAGRAVYQQACLLRQTLETTHALVEDMTQQAKGLIRVTCPRHFGLFLIQPNLEAFLKEHPDIRVSLNLSDRSVDMAAEGYDIGIRTAEPQDRDLVARKLLDTDVTLVASPAYLARHGTPQSMKDLSQHQTMVYEGPQTLYDQWQYQDQEQIKTVRIQPRFFVNDGYALYKAALTGLGIALLPEYLVRSDLASGQLSQVLTHIDLQAYLPTYIIYLDRQYLPPKTRLFINWLVTLCQTP